MLTIKALERAKAPQSKEEKLFAIVREIHSKTTVPVSMQILMTWGFNLFKEIKEEEGEVKPEEFRSRLLDLLRSDTVVKISTAIKKIGHQDLLDRIEPRDLRVILLSYFEGLSDLEAAVCCEVTEAEYRQEKADCLLNMALMNRH